jgi:replicative DNA helicase
MDEQNLAVPAFVDVESYLLSGLISDVSVMHRIGDIDADAFYHPLHAHMFRAIQSLVTKGDAVNAVSIHVQLLGAGVDVDIAELEAMAHNVYGPASLRGFARAVMDAYRMRQLMNAGHEIVESAMTPGAMAAEQIDKAQMALAKLATVKAKRDPQHITESLDKYLALLQDMSEGKNNAIRTGIGGLDKILNGGMRRGEVMVIGARPKHGKTALSLAMARNMARDHHVLFLSQEMPINQLMHRHTAAMGPFDLARVLAADAKDSEMWEAVFTSAKRLGDLNLHHDDQCSLTLMDIRRKVMKVKRERGLDVLFVDFLQLMAGAGEENRNRELDVIVNGIKAMALDLQLCVVVLSQMSRKADEHYSRPTMSYLRDSGAIEAAADQICLLFTDWAHPMSKRLPEFEGYAELEVVAHRNGPQGLVPMEFVGRHQQMGDWMRDIPKQPISATGAKSRAANF